MTKDGFPLNESSEGWKRAISERWPSKRQESWVAPSSPSAGHVEIHANARLSDDARGSVKSDEVVRRIAVLEPSDPNRDFIIGALRPTGHAIVAFSRFKDLAQALFTGKEFDLLVVALDGNLDAFGSGAKSLGRLASNVATLLLLARPEQLLESRCTVARVFTDFLLMPCEDCELVARAVRALAERFRRTPDVFVFGRYTFDAMSCTVSVGDQHAHFQPRQFQLALYLFQHANRAHSREEIFGAVWGGARTLIRGRTIDVHIAQVRKRLMAMSLGDLSLISIRNFGYCLFTDFDQGGRRWI